MKAILRLVLCPLAIWSIGVVSLAEPPVSGRVLILDTDRILEGDIERVGAQYRVRRSSGETWILASKVRLLCKTLEEAYVFLRDRANLEDPDERLRLARWCRLNGLSDQALHEATCALDLRPSHEATRGLIQLLKRAELAAKAEPTPLPAVTEALPPVDFNHESIGLFVTKVQPILMNTCVSCHGGAQSGAFKLTHTYANTQAHPRATRQNLAAVLAQVRREQPGESPLLSWAVTVHGHADKPPIKDRQSPAFKMLEEWVRLAVKGSAGRPDSLPGAEVFRPDAEAPSASVPFAATAPTKPEAKPASEPKAAPTSASEPKAAEPKTAEPKAPLSADPFDPAIFNRQNSK